jgi:hypothetical protein
MGDRLAEIQRMWPNINDSEFSWLVAALVAERATNEQLREENEIMRAENDVLHGEDVAERALSDTLAAALEMAWTPGSLHMVRAQKSADAALKAWRVARGGQQ